MKTKSMKTKTNLFLLLIITASLLLVFSGCDNIFNLSQFENKANNLPPGMGYLKISIVNDSLSNSQRTILPAGLDDNELTYKLSFYNTGENEHAFLPKIKSFTQLSSQIELAEGTYDLLVQAFLDADMEQLVAQSALIEGIDIPEGDGQDINIVLNPIMDTEIDSDQGTFKWIIENYFNTTPDTATMEIKPRSINGTDTYNGIGDNEPVDLLDSISLSGDYIGSVDLNAGQYEVIFRISRAGSNQIIIRKILHIYNNQTSILNDSNFILTEAHFNKSFYTVTFNFNYSGLSDPLPEFVIHGETAVGPTDPERGGHTFKGWYKDDVTFLNKFELDTPVTESLNLYARWEIIPSFGIHLSDTDHDFGFVFFGYDVNEIEPLIVTITNDQNAPTGQLSITPEQPDIFVLFSNTIDSIEVDEEDTFTIKPATGLNAGEYEVTITVSGANNINAIIIVTFEVKAIVLTHIKAEYEQGSKKIFPTTSLNDLKVDLTVTAYYNNDHSYVVDEEHYTLDGTLTEGLSVIAVLYDGKDDTFDVTVSLPALTHIIADYEQISTVYRTTSLDDLKAELILTAYYDNGHSYEVDEEHYSLEGTLVIGSSEITVSYDGEEDTIFVTVTPLPVDGVLLNKTTLTLLVDDDETLIPTVTPDEALNKTVTWSSSNTAVATVIDGLVTAVSVGTATITATTTEGEFTANCVVTVQELVSFSITFTADAAPDIIGPTIYLNSANGQTKATLTVNNPEQYSSIDWFINGRHRRGSTLTLNSADYSVAGNYSVTVEVVQNSRTYNRTIIFTVAE